MADSAPAVRCFTHVVSARLPRSSRSRSAKLIEQSKATPRTSDERLQQSLHDQPIDTASFPSDKDHPKTYLYLAYGSNLCALTFLDRRGIRPLSQVNVVVPAIRLTFDLPGIPYTEPCFGNCAFRNDTPQEKDASRDDYHKDRWHKGLVGVIYEVTASDYAHIIATEGGGSAYSDVLVDCYTLSSDASEPVPVTPTGTPFKAHTLYDSTRGPLRHDASYAQPSARYLKLITDGAAEHDLPTEYREYLSQIRPYQQTTTAQRLGSFIFLSIWGPIFAFFFMGAARVFLKPNGTYPAWFAKMSLAVFKGVWTSYDSWFKPMFGDGERTIEDGGAREDRSAKHVEVYSQRKLNEKTPLLADLSPELLSELQESGTKHKY